MKLMLKPARTKASRSTTTNRLRINKRNPKKGSNKRQNNNKSIARPRMNNDQNKTTITAKHKNPANSRGINIQSLHLPRSKHNGDCLGHIWITDQKLLIYLVDVSSGGVASATQARSLQWLMKSYDLGTKTMLNPAQALSKLNQIFPIEKQNNYFTMWYGVYSCGSRKLKYSTGGHPPALIIRETKKSQINHHKRKLSVLKLRTYGLGVGLVDKASYQNSSILIEPKDRLLIFSDGLYEFIDHKGKMWSYAKLCEHVAEHGHSMNVHTLTNQLMQQSGSGRFRDDCSVLLIDFPTEGEGPSKAIGTES